MNTVLVQVTQTFDALTSLTATLQTASTENFASPIRLTVASLPLASLVAGARFSLTTVPRGALRYLRLNYTVAGSNPTVGKITAGCGVDGVYQDTAIYPDAL